MNSLRGRLDALLERLAVVGAPPNRIQVTRATHDLIENEFVLEPRGMVAVKGKGEIETWYLVGRRRA